MVLAANWDFCNSRANALASRPEIDLDTGCPLNNVHVWNLTRMNMHMVCRRFQIAEVNGVRVRTQLLDKRRRVELAGQTSHLDWIRHGELMSDLRCGGIRRNFSL